MLRPARRGLARARAALRTLALTAAALTLSACTQFVPRGGVSDFFCKDYELPAYQPDAAEFAREVRRIEPGPATGSLGGTIGALAGGRRATMLPKASPGLGGLGGAALAHIHEEAERHEPLPSHYEVFALALPIISTDPNKGPTFGVLPVAVTKESARITNILAPDFTFNAIDGIGGMFRLRRPFSKDANLSLDAGTSTNGNDDYNVIYSQRRVGPNRALYYQVNLAYRTMLSTRFFGIGNETDQDAESSFVFRRAEGNATLGANLPLDLSLELRERIVTYRVGPGRLEDSDIPSTRRVFPNVDGVKEGRITIQAHRIRLVYDSRDSAFAPTEGMFGEFTYELADETLGSDIGFQRFGLALTMLIPKFRKRLTTVLHFQGFIMTGDNIPFFEQTTIGGRTTNRGYGQGRFVDRNGYSANVEERWNFLDYNLAGVNQVLQLAGFVDIGRVFAKGERFSLKKTKVSAGGSIRLIVPESELVTSIDIGFSDEGPAVFVELDYPF
ncbi:MAG: BamA/TamA family outer membrane protein [Planctomycetota bacterium]